MTIQEAIQELYSKHSRTLCPNRLKYLLAVIRGS